ncbi:MAG TPA: nodulation protein NfeD [Thermoanaerobaculia bacterium]|jgi:membrane-bound serine protease (ClpP class)|nr:nodulation protein NfeD [Thermoanaerobaculia bacterium]
MTTRAALLASLTLLAGVADTRSQTPAARVTPADRAPKILVARIDTPIHPAAANYLKKVLRSAAEEGAALVVVELSTPGGLLTSTREMTSAILQSKVPVVTYVAPSGAQSASAGFFILLAGDVAAMAPGTNAGAAHPVGGEGQDLPKTINEKAEQDARAYIRSLAHQRGRNAEKAEAAVAKSISYTETEAKDAGLIELIARDEPDLVKQLEGRTIKRLDGTTTRLALAKPRIETREMSRVEKLIGIVSHPNVAYLLFMAGLLGLYFELSSPGAVLPGVVGGIALLLALYAFSVLPVNLAGLALILFGIVLFIAEVKVVSHGVLAIGGAVSLIAGSLLLFSGRGEETIYRIDLSIIVPALVLTLAILGLLTWKTLELRMRPARTGAEGMVGETARVVESFSPSGTGRVLVHGEYWEADGPPGLAPGEVVRIARVDGLRVHVERRN